MVAVRVGGRTWDDVYMVRWWRNVGYEFYDPERQPIEGFMCQVTNPDMKRLDQLCQDHGLIMEKEITMSETKDHDTGRIIIRDGRIDFCEWRRL